MIVCSTILNLTNKFEILIVIYTIKNWYIEKIMWIFKLLDNNKN
jgi:hypothetical protein